MQRPIIGAVSYLNTKPLVMGIEEVGDEFELIYDLPSRLADRLAAGELTAGLIPIVEAGAEEYTVVSNACIACRGPVWSVKLLGRVSPEKVRSLALDEGSRTSAVLAQLILAKRFQIKPQTKLLGINEDWKSTDSDAVLVIGDRAMSVNERDFEFCWDLGAEWFSMTGLPFVFAVWAARNSEHLSQLDWILSTCRDTGLEHLEQICARYGSSYGLSQSDCLRYLGEHLHFELGPSERAGADLFFKWGKELGVLAGSPPRFFECLKA